MDKAALRARMRSLGAIPEEASAEVVAGLAAWMKSRLPGTVAAYLAMPDEVDLGRLIEMLPGWRWVLPRLDADHDLSFRDRDVPRELHRFGMHQPLDAGEVVPIHEIDMFLVPGLAFGRDGRRLGRGGGHYDRVLARSRPDSPAVGVTVEARVVDLVPEEGHDLRVEWLATERGVIECSSTR